jgi:hypothetical protein
MSNKVNCPSCGAPAQFAWRFAVQTACPFCKAVLVRHGVDVEKIGEAAELPADASPVQIGTEGQIDGRNFRVIGRIRYEAENAQWNEWHLAFFDSKQPENGWLSDAMAQYAVSYAARPQEALPAQERLARGTLLRLNGADYLVTTRTYAKYVGFEGELPFRTDERDESLFIDLKTQDARFGTLDYSEEPPLVFLGRQAEFDELKLTGLREFEGW